ncbi:MAG: glycosyltransferase family 2 protein [Candidatus Odinarchaeota archaeon]
MDRLVSIIILNYNKYQYTIDCLKSLENQVYKNFEVILVDNGSDYNLYSKLKIQLRQFKNSLNIRLIRSDKNLFFGAGNNKAIKEAHGDYICLLNYDIILETDFLKTMVSFLDSNPKAGMITPKIKIYNEKDVIWNAGAFLNFKSAIVIGNRGYLEYDPLNKKYNKIEQIGFAPGTALFMRKEVINEAGLMDEIFFMYHEDPDWNIQAQKKGYKSFYVPTTIVYHNIPRIIDQERMIFNHHFFTRNSQILVWKQAKITDIMVFYFIFSIFNLGIIFLNFLKLNFNRIKIRLISIWQGFRIGVRRRTNRSCSKYMISDYNYIKNLLKF